MDDGGTGSSSGQPRDHGLSRTGTNPQAGLFRITRVTRFSATLENAPETRLWQHVERLGAEHPPIDISTVDFTVRRPEVLIERFGGVLDYMARTELEVERNVLELATLLPDAPEIDRFFYSEVWEPQETQHGLILDRFQVLMGQSPASADLDTVSAKIRVVGALAHIPAFQDIVRMLYYLTGMSTERSALLAYHQLHDGMVELGEAAVAETVITPIRRQEPGHYAFYQMSSRALWNQLSSWQRWLVRHLRAISFSPVGAGSDDQRADVGDMMIALGLDRREVAESFAEQVGRVERDLLWAHDRGLKVPAYIARAFGDAVELAHAREAA